METSEGRTAGGAYRWFTAGVTAWFLAWGMNGLVFSWLVVEVLHAPAAWVGVAQSAVMLPSLALLLLGGAIADRRDPRGWIARLHGLALLPVAGLAFAISSERLALPVLVGYGLALGTISAFVMPARDALLSRVAGPDMMRAVAGMTIGQFGGQACGTFLAGSAESVGILTVLGAQAAVLAAGGAVTLRIPRATAAPAAKRRPALHEIAEGVRTVVRTPALRMPVLLVAAVGTLFIGPFLVTFPLLVRDHYGGGSLRLALTLMTFPVGAISGSLVIRALGGLRRKGRSLLLALAVGAGVLVGLSAGLSFPGFVAGGLVWGLAGSVFINASRTLMQERAPTGQRGRVLSVYQLGFAGTAPLGANLAGLAAGAIGPLATLLLFGAAMLTVVATAALLSSVAELE